MRRLLSVFILLILYGSFYPWRFSPVALRPFLIPFQFSDYRDLILNLWLYAPIGVLGYWAFSKWGKVRFVAPVVLASCLSLFVERFQVYVPGRVFAESDLIPLAQHSAWWLLRY